MLTLYFLRKLGRQFSNTSAPSSELLTQFQLNWKAQKNWSGGIKLNSHKQATTKKKIIVVHPGKSLLRVPVGPANQRHEIHVTPGQYVLKGQPLSGFDDNTVWTHAPTSGYVRAISEAYICGNELAQTVIDIEADGLDKRHITPHPHPIRELSKDELPAFLMRMGIVGLGGAGFPTGRKISSTTAPRFLLINGIECEPYITSDDRLMQDRPEQVVEAIAILAKILNVKYVRIGIECNKPKAIAQIRQAVQQKNLHIEVVEVPTFYPAGSQQSLIKSLTNIQLRAGQHPNDIGVVLMNIATAYAAGRAVLYQEPLTSRIVTLTGDVQNPRNLEVPIGTSIEQLLRKCQPNTNANHVWIGGPMMGKSLQQSNTVLGKTTNCLIVHSAPEFKVTTDAADCIRCSRCVDVCPSKLEPVQLYLACSTQNIQQLAELKLSACIECGACSSVCPSHIPLRDTFKTTKIRIR